MTGMNRDDWDDLGLLRMTKDDWDDEGLLGMTGMTRDY